MATGYLIKEAGTLLGLPKAESTPPAHWIGSPRRSVPLADRTRLTTTLPTDAIPWAHCGSPRYGNGIDEIKYLAVVHSPHPAQIGNFSDFSTKHPIASRRSHSCDKSLMRPAGWDI
jgi:hypothetical protein